MAVGLKSNMIVFHDEEYMAGVMESAVSTANVFNQNSLNTVVLDPATPIRGDYKKRSFLDQMPAPTRRDDTSVSALTAQALTMDNEIGVKVKRRSQLIEQTADAWRAISEDPREMANILGREWGILKMKEMRNTAVLCLESAMSESGVSALTTTTGATGPTPANLNTALATFGDAQGEIVFWLLHSTPWNNYIAQGITDKVDTIYSNVLANHRMPGLSRPFGVQDIPALTDANGSLTDTYNVLGLTERSVIAVESQPEEIAFERVTGKENLTYRFQAEYEYVVTVKGFKWDITNGGANPTDAAIGTAGNWDLAVTSVLHTPGVRLVVQ